MTAFFSYVVCLYNVVFLDLFFLSTMDAFVPGHCGALFCVEEPAPAVVSCSECEQHVEAVTLPVCL